MENSMSGAPSCNVQAMDSCEESSWTMYFEEFLADNKEQSSYSSGYESPSLVSDAACSAVKRFCTCQNEGFSSDKSLKEMRCKRKKIVDDSLEDTASSPVSSPKVFNLKQNEGNTKYRHTRDAVQEAKESTVQMDQRNSLEFVKRSSDCAELKKRGLCLVPLSMMANYFG